MTFRTGALIVCLATAAAPAIAVDWLSSNVEKPGPVRDLTIPIQAPVELDFLSKDDALDLRRRWVRSVPELAPAGYEPLTAIFGSIGDGKAWWGLEGLYGLANTEASIAGASEETRFMANPYLLVGVCEPNGWINGRGPDTNATYYPVPVSLVYRSRTEAEAVYNVSAHFSYLMQNNFANAEKRTLEMIAYNARDFGLNYLAVDATKSRNAVWHNQGAGKAAKIRQMIHVGASCGYPGGCNNASPYQGDLAIDVPETPARAVIKLWRSEPADLSLPADLTFTIDFI